MSEPVDWTGTQLRAVDGVGLVELDNIRELRGCLPFAGFEVVGVRMSRPYRVRPDTAHHYLFGAAGDWLLQVTANPARYAVVSAEVAGRVIRSYREIPPDECLEEDLEVFA